MAERTVGEVILKLKLQTDKAQVKQTLSATQKMVSKLTGGAKNFSQFSTNLAVAGKTLSMWGAGVAAAGTALGYMVNRVVEHGAEIKRNAAAARMSTDQYQELTFAAGQFNIEAGTLIESMAGLNEKAYQARHGNMQLARAFRRLGVVTRQSNGQYLSMEEMLPQIADGFKGLTSETKKVAYANMLFGGAGRKMLPMLEKGSEAIKEQRELFKEMGGGYSQEALDRMEETSANLKIFKTRLADVVARVFLKFQPAISKVVDWISSLPGKFKELTRGVDLTRFALIALTPVVIALGVAFFASIGWVGALFIAIAAAVVAVVLVVEDLIVAFKGGRSAIADFFQEFFGWDVVPVIDALVDGFYSAIGTAKVLWNFVKMIGNGLRIVYNVFSGVTKLFAAGGGAALAELLKTFGANDAAKKAMSFAESAEASAKVDMKDVGQASNDVGKNIDAATAQQKQNAIDERSRLNARSKERYDNQRQVANAQAQNVNQKVEIKVTAPNAEAAARKSAEKIRQEKATAMSGASE